MTQGGPAELRATMERHASRHQHLPDRAGPVPRPHPPQRTGVACAEGPSEGAPGASKS